ncbi:two-partner secretion domain-containing protein, partial [Aquicella lusitana]
MKKSFKSKTIGYWQNQLIKGIVAIATVFLTSVVAANPVLDNVASGNVSVQQSPNSTVINQSSQKAIINWRSFNIGQPESTHFQQPAGGVTLNRISPTQGPSSIYGRLTATGQIILMNPAGIFFGPSAYVNVGGLIATTANISNQDFLNGNYRFTHVSPYSGSIINEGQIIA